MRASASGAEGRGFESPWAHHMRDVRTRGPPRPAGSLPWAPGSPAPEVSLFRKVRRAAHASWHNGSRTGREGSDDARREGRDARRAHRRRGRRPRGQRPHQREHRRQDQVRAPDRGGARAHALQRREPRARRPRAAHGPVPQPPLHVRRGCQPAHRRRPGGPRQAHGGPAHHPHAEGGDRRPRIRRSRAARLRARPGRPRAALARRPGARRRRHRLRQRLHEREPAHGRGQARLQGTWRTPGASSRASRAWGRRATRPASTPRPSTSRR